MNSEWVEIGWTDQKAIIRTLGEEMIPLGNWQDRIDELESEIFDLDHRNSELEDEIADLLAERDELVRRIETADAQIREYARVGMEIATTKANVEGDRDGWRERAEKAEEQLNGIREVRDRALDARDGWKERAERAERALEVQREWAEEWRAQIERVQELQEDLDHYKQQAAFWEQHAGEVEEEAESAKKRAYIWSRIVGNYQEEIQRVWGELQEEIKMRKEFEAGSAAWESSFEFLELKYDELQKRANSWLEVAKYLVRDRDYWKSSSESWYEIFQAEVVSHDELKSALRTLAGGPSSGHRKGSE